jgi:predicted lipoprotein with Yx(FWY)xxD motif
MKQKTGFVRFMLNHSNMKLNKVLTAMLFALAIFWQLGCLAQNKMDLEKVKFNEDIQTVVKDIPGLHEGKLSGRQDMVSYGFDNDGKFLFAGVIPGHIELLSWKGKLVGIAFKIRSFADQQKVEAYFKDRYKNATFQTSKFMNVYTFKNDSVATELRVVIEEKYKEGANGYLDIKRADFAKQLEGILKP